MENNSPIVFHALSILREGQDIMVGRLDKESYASFPEDAVALLQQLQNGMYPVQAAKWYEQQYGEMVDMDDFLTTLRDLQFIRERNEPDPPKEASLSVSWQWLGRILFSPSAWIVYSLLWGLCLYTMLRNPILVPQLQDFFFSPSLTVNEIGLLLVQVPVVYFHEVYHALAGRRLGLPTKITIGHRLGSLTLETSLTSLWMVPRRSRYLPLLAGMLADTIVFSICIIVAWVIFLFHSAASSLSTFCLAVAYSTLLRLLWQFTFYLRTDLYYVFTTILGCKDLQQTTRAYVRNKLFKLLRRPDKLVDETQWYPRDSQVVRWYAPAFLSGYGVSISLLLFVGGPLTIQLFRTMFHHLAMGASTDAGTFLDITIFLIINCIPWVILGGVLVRALRKSWMSQWEKVQR